MESQNGFEQICLLHQKECGLFCPICLRYLCDKCYDDHITSGSILHSCQIYQILATTLSKSQIENNEQAISTLQGMFNLAISKLTQHFSSIMVQLSQTTATKQSSEKMLSAIPTEAMSRIKMLIQNQNVMAQIMEIKKEREVKSSNCMTKGKNIVDFVNSIMDTGKSLKKMSQTNQCTICTVIKGLYINSKFQPITALPQINLIPQNNLIHYWKDNMLTVYDTLLKSKSVILLEKNINKLATSISVENKIFLMGGAGPTDDVSEINFVNKSMTPKSSMLCKKFNHTLFSSSNYVYSLGGSRHSSSALADCEKYSIINDKWEKLPDMITPRCFLTGFIFDGYIYSLYGYNNGNLSSLERLKLDSSSWEMTTMKHPPSERRCALGIVLTDAVLLIGGTTNGINSLDDVILMRHSNGNWVNEGVCTSKLYAPSEFGKYSSLVANSDCVWCVDNENNIHTLSLSDRKWNMINEI